ncbi:DUF402 domain-containing protein [Micromonospora sp. CPCC 205711]|uniref:DUF402 domain-containing protein n=1 Tax=Micromonospora sp. CPCC 205547 TaxID=3122400 RepID=UPI002FF43962
MDVDVVFRKYSGSLHRRITMQRLGEDQYGIWLGARAGTTVHSGTAGHDYTTKHATVRLIPPGLWWIAIFFAEPSPWDVYCDVTTPPRWSHAGEVAMVDLDLDVLRTRADRRTELLDEEEFAANTTAYGYPIQMVAEATDTARHLTLSLTDGTEPFGSHYQSWLNLIV